MAEKTTTKKGSKTTSKEVLLSVYWYKGKAISVVGIQDKKTKVGHEIFKSALPGDAWFSIASEVKKISRMTEETRSALINSILSDELKVKFPVAEAEDLFNYVELKHEIVKKRIEV